MAAARGAVASYSPIAGYDDSCPPDRRAIPHRAEYSACDILAVAPDFLSEHVHRFLRQIKGTADDDEQVHATITPFADDVDAVRVADRRLPGRLPFEPAEHD